jgi:putative ABC transport system ATP-binding protein
MEKILKLENVSYSYKKNEMVLKDLNISFEKGKMYGVVGKSGSGKTTLLSLLSGLTKPKQGKILYKGSDLKKIDRYKYRSKDAGIIFQSFNLLPHLTAIENIVLSMDASNKKFDDKKKYLALELFGKVHLSKKYAKKKILHLSGGEQQRIAIARSLSFNPDIILADEPTGNLDIDTQNEIIDIFSDLAHKDNKCVIIVTHSQDVAKNCDEVIKL